MNVVVLQVQVFPIGGWFVKVKQEALHFGSSTRKSKYTFCKQTCWYMEKSCGNGQKRCELWLNLRFSMFAMYLAWWFPQSIERQDQEQWARSCWSSRTEMLISRAHRKSPLLWRMILETCVKDASWRDYMCGYLPRLLWDVADGWYPMLFRKWYLPFCKNASMFFCRFFSEKLSS